MTAYKGSKSCDERQRESYEDRRVKQQQQGLANDRDRRELHDQRRGRRRALREQGQRKRQCAEGGPARGTGSAELLEGVRRRY